MKYSNTMKSLKKYKEVDENNLVLSNIQKWAILTWAYVSHFENRIFM